MIYTESNVTLDFTGIKHFRFETFAPYQKLKGQSIKEIDFGWWDAKEKVLYLLELKDYTIPNITAQNSAALIANLNKKSVDSMTMLNSVWLSTPLGKEIGPCLPSEARRKVKVKIYHLIKINTSSIPLLLPLNQRLVTKFSGYKRLFNVAVCSIITHHQAKRKFPHIVR